MEQTNASFGEKLQNFWYYYKLYVIVAAVLVFILLFTLITGLQRREPDANLLYVGGKTLTDSQVQHIYDTLKQNVIKEDLNGNGEVEPDLLSLRPKVAGKDEYGEIVYDASFYQDYEHELYSGDTVIFLVESKDLYERMLMDDLLVPLEDIFGKKPDNAFDAFSFRLGDLDLRKLDAFKVFSENAYLCVRHVRVVNGQVTEGSQKQQEYNLEAFRAMAEYQFFVSDQM